MKYEMHEKLPSEQLSTVPAEHSPIPKEPLDDEMKAEQAKAVNDSVLAQGAQGALANG